LSGLKSLKKGEILFRENDPSDCMYVIKSGKIAITKAKGSSEIVLAELGPGDMLGEMAFFDSRARSAGAKASVDTVVIELPFKALNAQFKTFPEWLKAIVRTVNNHLRNANQKIKNLERSSEEETEYFPPHLVTKLMGILGLVAARYGTQNPEGIDIPSGMLRKYTIQVFQLPTAKMQRLMETLQTFDYMKVEPMEEDKVKLTMKRLDLVVGFTEFYNDWLYKSEDKKISLFEKEMQPIRALLHYGRKETPNPKGEVRVNLTTMQMNCITDLHFPFAVDDVDSLIEKKLLSEKLTVEGSILVNFNFGELEQIVPFWELIHTFKKIQRE
jgi:CRP/FNR family cyclic AMP-dependent transcriptional regulator